MAALIHSTFSLSYTLKDVKSHRGGQQRAKATKDSLREFWPLICSTLLQSRLYSVSRRDCSTAFRRTPVQKGNKSRSLQENVAEARASRCKKTKGQWGQQGEKLVQSRRSPLWTLCKRIPRSTVHPGESSKSWMAWV